MTKAEAIETLRANYPDACYDQLRQAVDAAIEALKAQDATGDTINRQAAIDALIKWYGCKPKDIEAFENIIKKIPSAQPERKKGHWIVVTRHEHYPSGKPYEKLQCPFCKKFDHNGDGNFCGYCGAEMQSGKNDG